MRTATLALLTLLGAVALPAQDVVTLHSVTILPSTDVRVVYSKNFATCAHMKFSNASCGNGALTHVQNHFCTSGTNVTITLPSTAFVGGFGPGVVVKMAHGNNSGIASPCISVTCDGSYGVGCVGSTGTPVLAANCCPAAGTTMSFDVSNALPGSLSVIGFGLGQTAVPLLGCTLLVDQLAVLEVLQLDGAGAVSLPLPVPATASGASVTAQVYVLDGAGPQGYAATNAVFVQVL